MAHITCTRDLQLPDDLRVKRALGMPHLGPRILFFSGGSALNGISRRLKSYTFNSTHLITPFDSGGSSQVLREAFDMPAVGDLRSRLMALADESDLGQPDIFALFSHRLPKTGDNVALAAEVQQMVEGCHPLVQAIARPMRKLIQNFLQRCLSQVPEGFDFRNASIGNLILAGGYLDHNRELEPVLFLMSKMVDVRGTVRAIVDANLHLGVQLRDGSEIIGQRLISGKEAPPLTQPIAHAFTAKDGRQLATDALAITPPTAKLIAQADVICYPPGSLYSSVIANLLPAGVGRGIAARRVPKVYLPNLGHDPEAIGLSLRDQVAAILAPLRQDARDSTAVTQLMSHVICDNTVPSATCAAIEEEFGITCLRLPLAREDGQTYAPQSVCDVLVTLG